MLPSFSVVTDVVFGPDVEAEWRMLNTDKSSETIKFIVLELTFNNVCVTVLENLNFPSYSYKPFVTVHLCHMNLPGISTQLHIKRVNYIDSNGEYLLFYELNFYHGWCSVLLTYFWKRLIFVVIGGFIDTSRFKTLFVQ